MACNGAFQHRVGKYPCPHNLLTRHGWKHQYVFGVLMGGLWIEPGASGLAVGSEAIVQSRGTSRIILVLAALTTFAPFATDMYLPSFPGIAHSLGCSVGQVQLSLSAFFLGLALGQLFYGPLIDRYGRRVPLLCGVLLFAASSLALLLVHDIGSFVALRFVQAVGGCAGMVVSRAIIQDLFEPREAARALSLMMVIQGIGPIVAPVLGAYVIARAGWQAVFVFLFVLSMGCLLAACFGLPESLPVQKRRRDSIARVFINFFALIGRRDFIVPTVASSYAVSMMFAFIAGSSFVFMTLYGVSTEVYGWLFGLNAVCMTIASQCNRVLLRRVSPQYLLWGAVLIAIAASVCALFALHAESLPVLMVPLFLALAMGPIVGANGTAIAMAASGHHAGAASSLVGVLQFGFASVVSALVGALHNGTAYPMLGTICVCSVLAGVALLIGGHRRHPGGSR
jgi:DHA1 family bicyclomycin/chloramphenicol resistance-like MFS transporter